MPEYECSQYALDDLKKRAREMAVQYVRASHRGGVAAHVRGVVTIFAETGGVCLRVHFGHRVNGKTSPIVLSEAL